MTPRKAAHAVIGIDGGGTKTHLVLCNAAGETLAQATVGRSNIHTSTAANITVELRRGLQSLLREAKLGKEMTVDVVVAGLAGIDHKRDEAYAHEIVSQAAGSVRGLYARVRVVNDTIIGLYAGAANGQGICIIGGTGSNCYGRNEHGEEAWAGGLGHIIADEGSGYDIGLRVLMAAAKAEDGRGPKTMLLPLVLKRYGVKTMRDLVPSVYANDYGKVDIAQLAYDVQLACAHGDRVAKHIALGAGGELAAMVLAVANKLFGRMKAFDIVLIGGVLQHDPIVQREMKRLVKAEFGGARFIIPKDAPVMGAVRLALATRR